MSGNVLATRNLFIDTEAFSSQGDGTTARFTLPSTAFSIKGDSQQMCLTLTTFEVRKNWTEINKSNNVFFLWDFANNVLYPCIIPPGSYRAFQATTTQTTTITNLTTPFNYGAAANQAFPDLASGIKYAVDKALYLMHAGGKTSDWNGTTCGTFTYPATLATNITTFSSTVTWSPVSRKFTISFPIAIATQFELYCFQVKSGDLSSSNATWNQHANNINQALYGNWTFQDVHEILGSRPTRDADLTTNNGIAGFTHTGTTAYAMTSIYCAQLNSLEALYLRINSQSTNNYQTPGQEMNSTYETTMIPTTILARFPMDTSVYDDINETITFTDTGGDIFQIYLDTTMLTSLQLSLTDDKGRVIAPVALTAPKDGNLSFKCTLRYDVIEKNTYMPPTAADIIHSLTPVGFVNPATPLIRQTNQRDVVMSSRIPKSAFAGKSGHMNP